MDLIIHIKHNLSIAWDLAQVWFWKNSPITFSQGCTFRENRDFVFITIVQFMLSSNIIRLFVQNTISLSSLCKLIWRHWTYKMPVRYILLSVWVRLSIFSQLSIIQYMGLCVFSLPISLVMIEMIYTLCYYHHQIGSMNYYPLFRARSWNNGMRCTSIFLLYYFWDSKHHCCNMSIFSSIKTITWNK